MTVSKIFRGFLWTYGSQIVSNVIQFAYAAVTSRLIGANGFGSFAIALTTSSLISLVANGGLAQTASRLQNVDGNEIKNLQTYALASGLIAGIFTFFSADFWADVWGQSDISLEMKILSLSVLIGPFAVLASGVTRRNGYYRFNGIALLITNIVGMSIGALCVYSARMGWALLISPLLAQLLLTAALNLRSRKQLGGFKIQKHLQGFHAYNVNVIFAKVATYVVVTLPTWTFARFFGVAVVGDINRAGVFTTTPLYQVQVAMVQALSPEFRHDIESPNRAKLVWTDLLLLIAWFALPTSFVIAVLAYLIVPLAFGTGWFRAALFSVPLALIAGVQVLVWVLDSAIEAIGNFKVFWTSLAAATACNVAGILLAINFSNCVWIFFGITMTYGFILRIFALN